MKKDGAAVPNRRVKERNNVKPGEENEAGEAKKDEL
jgi:hypothetical protein